ncbi:ribosome small subunit-dependent GTPase A [Motiliproteus sp. MSK22-1]|uniref:ribosome small subunit-dependent GTPase A n=1 Tax=Motiliproteus sp. MSK22-1 TaxID=1897630 RepID=UPI0009785619|nr:ribosome small subunit-dependent GTPase A [Motiliproteus sp. MSK22-1]OMH29080.1 ribosome small subunit-dependent GTPase A [Motiliproteus sp. MSK22-1]
MTISFSLTQLGWKPYFQQQLTLEESETYTVGRVIGQHRSNLEILTEQGKQTLPLISAMPVLTVGDWVLLEDSGQIYRSLERLSLFSRKASGNKVVRQLIAANVDTVFIVCSLNSNFNLNRIERYLALANEAAVEPVVVLTKSDCCENPVSYVEQVQSLDSLLMVEAINSLDPTSVEVLESWCSIGRTVAFLGSSGVGKSTLVNTLLGLATQETGSIREEDSKGRHTTTARSLHLMPMGGLLLDTPGMRELQLTDCEKGVEETFAEISELASQCRFTDCHHQNEPGCAIQAAVGSKMLDKRRLDNYLKLMREQALNSASLAEKRARDRNLGHYYRSVLSESRQRKKG